MKQCWKCAEIGVGPKPYSDFNKDARGTFGLQGLCRKHQRERYQVWLSKNAERNRERNAEWYAAHPDKIEENKARWAAYGQKRDQEQPNFRCSREAKRRAAKLQRTVAWSNEVAVDDIYALAQAMREFVPEIEWHVDHYYPMQGTWVSGLHVENNLQVLPGIENCSKGVRQSQVEFRRKDMRDLVRAAQSVESLRSENEPETGPQSNCTPWKPA